LETAQRAVSVSIIIYVFARWLIFISVCFKAASNTFDEDYCDRQFCLSLCQSAVRLRSAITDERVPNRDSGNSRNSKRHVVLDGSHDPPRRHEWIEGVDATFARLLWPRLMDRPNFMSTFADCGDDAELCDVNGHLSHRWNTDVSQQRRHVSQHLFCLCIKPRCMHKAAYCDRWSRRLSVSLSVCLSRELKVQKPKTAERIDVLFGVETPGDRRNIVLDGSPPPLTAMRPLPNYFGRLSLLVQRYLWITGGWWSNGYGVQDSVS